MSSTPRYRFAPSPTGTLHVGNARTALFNFFLAKKTGGSLVLRIEDTDIERSTAESEKTILEDLRWLGLDWDEGPDIDGASGPYRQSERSSLYREAAEKILSEGLAYHCFCSPAELEEERTKALSSGGPAGYGGRCRGIDRSEAARRVASGEKAALRFAVTGDSLTISDGVRGEVSFDLGQFGDFVIVRSSGVPAYNFAVVVDDSSMGITDVVRGEDHLSNTPKQVLLYRALGHEPPRFAHLPMILGPDNSRLSKRHGAVSVHQYREEGILPGALRNFLALLGWSPGDDREVMSPEELISSFSLDRVSRSASVFNPEKLLWMNGMYLRSAPVDELWEEAGRRLAEAGFLSAESLPGQKDKITAVTDLCRGHLKTIEEIVDYGPLFFREDPGYGEEALAALAEPEARRILEALLAVLEGEDGITPEAFRALMKTLQKDLNVKGKTLFPTVRLAVSGKSHGPDLAELFCLLGVPLVRRRISGLLAESGGQGG